MIRTAWTARLTRAAALGALALTIGLTAGFGPAAAAPAALPLPAPDLRTADVHGTAVDLTWTDWAFTEDGYEIVARVPTKDGSIDVTTKMIKGAIPGTGGIGRGSIDGLKAGQTYCIAVRAYQLHTVGDTYSPKSNEICRTTANPTSPATSPKTGPLVVSVARSSPEYIKWLQAALNKVDGANMPVDGNFGPVTDQAVRHFQANYKLTVDGIVGDITEKALIAAGASSPPGNVRTGVARMP